MGWRDFQMPHPVENVEKQENVQGKGTDIPYFPLIPPRDGQNLAGDTERYKSDLRYWIKSIRHATTEHEIFSLLNEFQTMRWSDEQRAQIAHIYHRQLEVLTKESTNGN